MYEDHLATPTATPEGRVYGADRRPDLPEEAMQLIAAFVEFLRARRQEYRQPTMAASAEREPVFPAWPLGVKGTLSREELSEHL
jgi:hypothetical protein